MFQRALNLVESIKEKKGQIFLSDVLLNETLSVLAKRCKAKKNPENFSTLANDFQKKIEGLPILCFYELLSKGYSYILKIMKTSQGCFNFHDSLILYLMQSIPEVTLVTFDQDFKKVPGLKILN